MSSQAAGKRVALAAVAGAHGVKGELRLKLFADSVDSLARLRFSEFGLACHGVDEFVSVHG